jgi:hypothetical protein
MGTTVHPLYPGQGDVAVETPRIGSDSFDLRLDWDRIGLLLATFGIACAGLATVVYSVGFLVQALSQHV